MNKFQKLISGNNKEILTRRAGTISTQAEVAQQTVVNTVKNKVSELELKVDTLTDLAPNETTSLRPGSKNWDPKLWAEELQRTKWELHLAKMQLEIAEDTYKEFFTVIE